MRAQRREAFDGRGRKFADFRLRLVGRVSSASESNHPISELPVAGSKPRSRSKLVEGGAVAEWSKALLERENK